MFSDLDDSNNLPGLSVFNQLEGWIWELDQKGSITKCNPDVENLLGFKCETLINQPLSQISDVDIHFNSFPRELDDQTNPKRFEITFYHVDGKKVKTTCYVAPRFGPQDSFLGWTGMTILEDQDTDYS